MTMNEGRDSQSEDRASEILNKLRRTIPEQNMLLPLDVVMFTSGSVEQLICQSVIDFDKVLSTTDHNDANTIAHAYHEIIQCTLNAIQYLNMAAGLSKRE